MLALSLAAFQEPIRPVRTEVIAPIEMPSFNKGGAAEKRRQGGNPRTVEGLLVFDGSQDGNRQVDPQIAVGGGFVFHATNSGLVIYSKKGEYVDGVPQSEFNGGIDPKLFFNLHRRCFTFNLWNPWDDEKKKPVNISVSRTADPRGAWSTYPVPAPQGVDGGAIGYSRRWIGYSFPGGEERTFVLKAEDAQAGAPVKVHHFLGGLGQPVFNQDASDDLVFVQLTDREIILTTVGTLADGSPGITRTARSPHGFPFFGWPPQSPMKGTEAKTASGDRNPKCAVLQNGFVWFSHTVNVNGRAGVQWRQVGPDARIVQSGLIADPVNSFIQTTLGVNQRGDVLVGYQETGPGMFISPRLAWRRASDPKGTLRPAVRLGEGLAATEGGSWGDYSGTIIDGDNLADLWTIQSIANEQGRGSCVIARVEMGG